MFTDTTEMGVIMSYDFSGYLTQVCREYPEIKFDFHLKEWETDFLRFFNSEVNYNISKKAMSLYATMYKGKRSYSFEISNPTQQQVKESIEQAVGLIDKLPEDPDFVDLEDDLRKTEETEKNNNIQTLSLNEKIDMLEKVAAAVKPFDYTICGSFICNYQTLYIVNSNGVNKKMVNSPIMLELKAVAEKNEVTVIESFGGEDLSMFNLNLFIEQLLAKVEIGGKEIIDVEPDYYEVILAPRCVAEFLGMLIYAGMTASSYDRKISYFENLVDKKVFPEFVTIVDNPGYSGLINFDYNSDGHIYQKTVLVEDGVFRNFLTNNYYSHKTGLAKNGAEAECIVMEKGDTSLRDMFKEVKKGLYISNLHYMNFINRKETSVTGLTRDGTFLIENGEYKNVVNNLRFTVKITDVFKSILQVENLHYLIPMSDNYGEFGINSYAMPHIRVKAFKITSSTKTI
jgi:PmbA protein